jgi:copper transport protein
VRPVAADRAAPVARQRPIGVVTRRRVALAVLVALLVVPQAASAHAVLEGTVPGRGAQLQHAPKQVVLRFGEPVEAAFGAVRVFDQHGGRVDRGGATHPDGRGEVIAVALRGGLGQGTYTATYRVISADSHPVSGGFVFTVGHGGTPVEALDQLIDAGGAGKATEVGFGIVRGLAYLALALAAGGAAFVLAVWRPAFGAATVSADARKRAKDAFGRRVGMVAVVAVALGISTSALGIVFQGAVAGGTSFWSAFDPTVVRDVLHTHFGTVWGLRLLAWILVGALLVYLPAPPRGAIGFLALLLGFLCVTPALAGHASTASPAWLLVPANVLHVVCMAVWVGGVAMLLAALPAATRVLDPADRTRLLAGTITRFSAVALIAVAGLVAGGTIQAIAELDALSDFTTTPFGRAIVIKIGIVLILIGFGAWNRQRARPRLVALAAEGATPGATGAALRRSLRVEMGLMVAALGVTAALVSYAPATAASGPFSASETIGPARLELTADPARVGPNQIHLYLFGRATGRQYDRIEELRVTAALPSRGIGPLPLRAAKAGPGHYVIRRAQLAPAGDWRLEVSARVSAFDAYTARVEVPIR